MKLDIITTDEQFIDDNSYLFYTRYGRGSFIIIQEEMESLNDYCVTSMRFISEEINKLNSDLKKYSSGEDRVDHPDFGDVTSEVIMGLEEFTIPKWKDIQSFLHRANCFLLIYIFMEKSTKTLCITYSSKDKLPLKQKSGLSKLFSHIDYLKNSCGYEFSLPNSFFDIFKQINKIRNSFVHGDWDDVENLSINISLLEVFKLSSLFFQEVEEAIERSYD